MNSSIRAGVSRLLFLSLAITAASASVSYAQVFSGGFVGNALQPAPTALQAGVIPHIRSMPVLRFALQGPAAIGTATTTNLFAQFAFGGGYTTTFTFLNTGIDATTGNLILTSDSGAPLSGSISSNGGSSVVASSVPISVPSGGSQSVTVTAINPNDPFSAGWARVESSGGNLGGVANFQFVSGGVLTYDVGVLSAATTNAATVPINDNIAQGQVTGYAVANTGSTPITVKIVLVNPDGSISQTLNPAPLTQMAPGTHVARFVYQDAANSSTFAFNGTMVLIETSGQPFSVVALASDKGIFAALPVVAGKASGIQ